MANAVMRPVLATAGPSLAGSQWAYEFAWDGIRSLADVRPDRVRLLDSHSASYPGSTCSPSGEGFSRTTPADEGTSVGVYDTPSHSCRRTHARSAA